MTRASKKSASLLATVLAWPLTVLRPGTPAGRAVAIAAIVAVFITGSIAVWNKLQSHVSQQQEYLVSAGNLVITPRPEWIDANVLAEVSRANLPPQLSILDPRLSQLVTQAFALHPWVQSVEKVETAYPAEIRVTLVYRRPVAMVEVQGGLLPVDADGVLLPPEDFTPVEAQQYPRVAGVASSPLGPIGTRWGDPAVQAAARVAATLAADWTALALHHVQPTDILGELALLTKGGTLFTWGRAPGEERDGEPKAAEKLTRLKKLLANHKSLDSVPREEFDLGKSTEP